MAWKENMLAWLYLFYSFIFTEFKCQKNTRTKKKYITYNKWSQGHCGKKITVEKKEKKKPALDLRPSHVSVLAFFHWDSGGFINAFGRLKKDKIKILLCASTLAVNRIRQPQSNKQTNRQTSATGTLQINVISKHYNSKKLMSLCYHTTDRLHRNVKKADILFAYCTFS